MALGSSHPSLELDFSSQMGWSWEVILDQGPWETHPVLQATGAWLPPGGFHSSSS